VTEFRTDAIFEALKSPLGLIDDPHRRQQIEAYIEAARTPLERAVHDLLSQLAEGVNAQVSTHYEVALSYRQGVLDLEVRAREPAEATEEAWSFSEGDVEKVTIRIPAELKELATDAAAKASLSANAWFVRVLARALRNIEATDEALDERRRDRKRRHGERGQRLSGWVGPDGE